MAIRVYVHDDAVDIGFDGSDRWLALSTGVHLSMSDITDARVARVDELKDDLGWRVGGSYWPFSRPGRIIAGHFTHKGRRGARQLWDVRGHDEVLVIDTRRERPSRVVLEVPDSHDLAWLIGERLPTRH